MSNTLGAIKKVYELIGFETPEIIFDIRDDYLTEHEARNGRNVIWYLDETYNVAVYTDTLEVLSDEEIEKELC